MDDLIAEVLTANLLLPKHNLVMLTWGNVSAVDRARGLVVIKPSGIPYDALTTENMAVVDMQGRIMQGNARPSSDTLTHLHIYRQFPAVGAVVHTHSPWATTWAQANRFLPAYGTTHADYFFGPVPCTRRLTDAEINSGYEEATGRLIVETFQQQGIDPEAVPAVLVAGHGAFTWGKNALRAVENALVLEQCAMMALGAEVLNANLTPLQPALLQLHYLRKHGKNATYGQPKAE